MDQLQMLAIVLVTLMGVAATIAGAKFSIRDIREGDGRLFDWASAAAWIGCCGFTVLLAVEIMIEHRESILPITVVFTTAFIVSYVVLHEQYKLEASIEDHRLKAVQHRCSKIKASAEARKCARAAWKSYVDRMVACDVLAEQARPFSAVARARKVANRFNTMMPATLKTEEAVHAHPFAQTVITYEQACLKTHGKRERTTKKLNAMPRTTPKATWRRQTKKKES